MAKVIIGDIDDGFETIPNRLLRSGAGLKAIGLYAYMRSLPGDWNFSVRGLTKILPEGEDSIRAAIQELEEVGFLKREQNRQGGRLSTSDYILYNLTPRTGKLEREKPAPGKPAPGNPSQLHTIKQHTIKQHTKRKKEGSLSKKFQKPTGQELQEYTKEHRYNVDHEAFLSFYESNGWKVGKNSMKDWKAAVRTWHLRENKESPPATISPKIYMTQDEINATRGRRAPDP